MDDYFKSLQTFMVGPSVYVRTCWGDETLTQSRGVCFYILFIINGTSQAALHELRTAA